MKTKEVSIRQGEWLLSALNRLGYDWIPTNTLLNKTLTGLGATHCEIHSKRNSIIIEPNVPVILGKLAENQSLEAVYEKCTPYTLKKYLRMDIPYKKILTTPESFHKIRKEAQALNINIYQDYFCLFDECEKITQDVDYRRKIAQPIYDFFQFENKAFVSATPLAMSHKEFERQDFQEIKIVPDYDYQKDLNLIVTNNSLKTLKEVLDNKKESKHICIFFNVTDGIHAIVEKLGITDYKIFCSQKSVDKLAKRGIQNAYSQIDYPLAKYNFFTCRFYSGLDIVLGKHKPDIILLTDFSAANWTIIDPFTEAIQIQGRFRKTKEDEVITYNSLTHITTINPDMRVRSNEDVRTRIEQFIENYNQLKERHDNEADSIKQEAIFEDMQSLKYQELIDEQGEINAFSVDNLYNEERVKACYTSAQSLYQAYQETGFFKVSLQDISTSIGDDDLIKLNRSKTKKERWKILVKLLDKISQDYAENKIEKKEYDGYLNLLRSQEDSQYIIDAYLKIGKEGIEKANYLKGQIDKSVKQFDKEMAESLRFFPEVKKAIQEEFEMNVYINKNEIRNRLQAIYNEKGINFKVTQDTITDYYTTDNSGSIKGGSYKLKEFKPIR